jgi:two-component system response regulator (stage 0 sporulation protein F)
MRQQPREILDPPPEIPQAAVLPPTDRQPQEPIGVLVVDDQHLVRIMVQLGLERNGFEVWQAANGREAIDLYREHREQIAVVLLDVCMPGLDGLQTLDALLQLNPSIVACFMSGDPGADRPGGWLRRGAAPIIAKPFHLDVLANVLRLLVQDLKRSRPGTGG